MRYFLIVCLIFLVACEVVSEPAIYNEAVYPTVVDIPVGELGTVVDVIDGDTVDVELEDGIYRVRYIGVDTPERDEPFYQEATEFNNRLVLGEEVILVRDVSDTDQYGRLLRYIYRADGVYVNAAVIDAGMGRVVTFPPDVAEQDYFLALQTTAREGQVGLWSLSAFNPNLESGCNCERNAYNCRDFSSQADAQACFDMCMEIVGEDIHQLDGGGDGVVCESLP